MRAVPELGLLVDPAPPPPLAELVRALATWYRPCAATPETRVACWLASSPDCRDLSEVAASGRRLAVWVDDPHALSRALDLPCPVATLVTSDPRVAGLRSDVVLFPVPGIDLSTTPPLAPMVRARWRARLRLPGVLVVTADDDRTSVPPALVPTGLALASAVVARGRWLLEALALGSPCVTDAPSAAALGTSDGVDVLVEEPSCLDRAAADLARDERQAACLGRAGRRLVERRHDQHRSALDVAKSLGLVSAGTDAVSARVNAFLDDLGAPLDSKVRRRALALVQAEQP